mgnify:CR=1 FL=1
MGVVRKVAIALFLAGLGVGYFMGYYVNTDRRYKISKQDSVPYLIDKQEQTKVVIDDFTFLDAEKINYDGYGERIFRGGINKIKREVGDSIDSLVNHE